MTKNQKYLFAGAVFLLLAYFLWFKDWYKNYVIKNNIKKPILPITIEPALQKPPPPPPVFVPEDNGVIIGENIINDNIYPPSMYYDNNYTLNTFDATIPRSEAVPLQKRRQIVYVEEPNNFGGVIQNF